MAIAALWSSCPTAATIGTAVPAAVLTDSAGPSASAQILPVEYCHLILTVPKPITQLAMINQRALYSLVLREGAYTVLDGGRKLFGLELALLSLLHTWGQILNGHLHTHSLLPLGGLRGRPGVDRSLRRTAQGVASVCEA